MPRGKSNNRSAKEAGEHLPALVDLRHIKSLSHVLRQHILLAAVQSAVSPKELAEALNEGLSEVSYHVKVLKDHKIITLVKTEPRRGAVEHYYRANQKTLFSAKAWCGLKKGLRTVIGAGQASDLFNDLADALKAGKLQGDQDQIIRTPLVLDAEGKRNVKAIAQRATKEVESEQQAAAKRLARTNGDGGEAVGYTFALLAFEAAWEPTDLCGLTARAENVTEGGFPHSLKLASRGRKRDER
jgi:DNA-binding transcriptional ArsR family regulator